MDKELCKDCLCATCRANITHDDRSRTNVCVGCENCDDFAVSVKKQCPLGKYEKSDYQTIEVEDKTAIPQCRNIVTLTNRIIYGCIALVLILAVFVRNNAAIVVVEALILVVAFIAHLVHKKYTDLLTNEAFARLKNINEQEQADV